MKQLILLFVILGCVYGEKFRYDNYTLYKVLPGNEKHIKVLQDLHNNDLSYDFWSDPHQKADFVSILSSPEKKSELEKLLNDNGIRFEIPLSNIQEAIEKETVSKYTRNNVRSMRWDVYYNLPDINAWLDDLVRAYPRIVGRIVGGRSYEGRNITGIKISHGTGRKAIFIESAIHAREWITPTAVCFIINELLTSNNTEIRAAARDYDWYIFPVTNPDGYIFSHESNRMWRKNRRPVANNNFGVDLNRNWNNNWLVSGASTNPATDIYAGPGPFSEPETRSLSAYIRAMASEIEMYLSFHSFSQLLLLPFGNTTEPLANYHDAINIGRRAMGALSVRFGTQYVTGNIAEAIYIGTEPLVCDFDSHLASFLSRHAAACQAKFKQRNWLASAEYMATGGSIDWVKEHLKIPLVYCYELRDRGDYGFLLPTDQILPNNQETMDSLIELIHQARRFGYLRR